MARKKEVRFSQEIADEICDKIALGNPVQNILMNLGEQIDTMPTWQTLSRWLRTNEAFREQYEIARVHQADYLADQMLGYVDKAANDPKGANGYKVAADILRWQAMVRSPRKYSDRLIQENTVKEAADPDRVRAEIDRLKKELGVGTRKIDTADSEDAI